MEDTTEPKVDQEPLTINAEATIYVDAPPCCVLFSCISLMAVVGMYNLVETIDENGLKRQARTGALQAIQLPSLELGSDQKTGVIKKSQTFQTTFGILDLVRYPLDAASNAWHNGYADIFAAATSEGTIVWFGLVDLAYSRRSNILEQIRTMRVEEPNVIITQLTWAGAWPDLIGFTTATGSVKVVKIPSWNQTRIPEGDDPVWNPAGVPIDQVLTTDLRGQTVLMHEHSLEAWTCSFPKTLGLDSYEPRKTNTDAFDLYTGGDDAVLGHSSWTISAGPSGTDANTHRSWLDKKTHQAGVTAVLPFGIDRDDNHPRTDLLITGSYDDHIRVLQVPTVENGLCRPVLLGERNLGGGVWRFSITKHAWSRQEEPVKQLWIELAVCCMYAGVKIVRLSGKSFQDLWSIDILAQFTGHESICYGLDSRHSVESNTSPCEIRSISCSFYDRRVCLWGLRR